MKNNDKRTKKDQKTVLLILPVCMLLLFISLFVGASISRNHLRKELIEIKENTDKRGDYKTRLSVLETRNRTITYIIGRDSETEQLISDLQMKR
jgi:di/tricarboxylate transporter